MLFFKSYFQNSRTRPFSLLFTKFLRNTKVDKCRRVIKYVYNAPSDTVGDEIEAKDKNSRFHDNCTFFHKSVQIDKFLDTGSNNNFISTIGKYFNLYFNHW